MRTAAKLSLTVFLALAASGVAPCQAQMPAPGPGAVAFPGEQPQTTEPAVAKTEEKPKAPEPQAAAVVSTDPNKVPDSVKDVLDKMDKVSEDVTLDDLNTAREAIAKLDVLIDIEKRLTDLAGIRKEREEKTMAAVAGALPTTAYAPPPAIGGSPSDYGLPSSSYAGSIGAPPVNMGPGNMDVLKIIGAEGRYVAYVKDGEDGKEKAIRKGDKMEDGSVVSAISRSGVTMAKGKKTKTFQVKDIAKVFGGR